MLRGWIRCMLSVIRWPASPRRRARRRGGALRGQLPPLLSPRPPGDHRRAGRAHRLRAPVRREPSRLRGEDRGLRIGDFDLRSVRADLVQPFARDPAAGRALRYARGSPCSRRHSHCHCHCHVRRHCHDASEALAVDERRDKPLEVSYPRFRAMGTAAGQGVLSAVPLRRRCQLIGAVRTSGEGSLIPAT
jgi:hypothetical protein